MDLQQSLNIQINQIVVFQISHLINSIVNNLQLISCISPRNPNG